MLNVDNDGGGFEMISLELLSEENSLDIYSFEKENREYFERNLPPRPANYFDLEGFKEITRELLTEQRNRDVYMHLIRDSQGVMVGRINFKGLHLCTVFLGRYIHDVCPWMYFYGHVVAAGYGVAAVGCAL